MSNEEIIQYLLYGVLGVGSWIIRQQWVKLESLKDQINRTQIELTKQSQENSELYNNVRRIDDNIDKLFDKIDTLLTIVRENGSVQKQIRRK
jgi:peptidoglycan hydrolase CwlO-like protein